MSVPVDGRYLLRALPNEHIFLYSKPIDNSRVVREPHPTARGEWRAIGLACALAVLFMGLLTPRVANIFAGYQLESLRAEQHRLLDEQRDLDIAEARLSRQENLEVLAKRRELSAPAPARSCTSNPRATQAGSEPPLISYPAEVGQLWNPSPETEPASV